MARPERIKTELGERLRGVRKRLAKPEPSREDFSKIVGSTKNSIANYERGDTLPDAAVLEKYNTQLHINLNWLLTGEGNVYDDVSLEKSSGDTLMSEDQDKVEWSREVFHQALKLANEFEAKQGGKKLMPEAKIELIDEFYKDIMSKK